MSLLEALLVDPILTEIWIAPRPEGAIGSGTADDAYSGGKLPPQPVLAISFITFTLREATVLLPGHPYKNSDAVTITGPPGASPYVVGDFAIHNVVPGVSFQYTMEGIPGSAGAGFSCQRDVYLFDAVMRRLPTDRPVIVRLCPGTFETRGYSSSRNSASWVALPGMKIRGSGMGSTTIKLVGALGTHKYFSVVGSRGYGYGFDTSGASGFEVSDLTLDANISNQPSQSLTCGGLAVYGNNTLVRRVRAINFGRQGTPSGSPECFTLLLGGANYSTPNGLTDEPFNCVFEDCVVECPGTNNVKETTCIAFLTGESTLPDSAGVLNAFNRGCVVRNCYINAEYQDNPTSIETLVPSVSFATVTTRAPHGLTSGQWVRISGVIVDGNPSDGYDNPYNGSYKVLATSNDRTLTYIPTGPGGAVFQDALNPLGEMWVGRWPSHYVPLNGTNPQIALSNLQAVTPSPPAPAYYELTVLTATAHYLIDGSVLGTKASTVAITGIYRQDLPVLALKSSNLDGAWTVTSVLSSTKFTCKRDATDFGPDGMGGLLVPDSVNDANKPLYTGLASIGVTFQGISLDGGSAMVMEGNRIFNCRVGGSYHDTWSGKDLTMRNNHFRGVLYGPLQTLQGGWTSVFDAGVVPPIRPAPVRPLASGLTSSGLMATFTLKSAKPHGFSPGQGIRIEFARLTDGNLALNSYNGFYVVDQVVGAHSFQYRMDAIPLSPWDGTSVATVSALWQTRECIIENNTIELIPSTNDASQATAILFYGALPGVFAETNKPFWLYRRVSIKHNIIRYQATPLGSPLTGSGNRDAAVILLYAEYAVVENNLISLASARPLWDLFCGKVSYFNNRDLLTGKLLQGVTGPAGASAKQDELCTVIDDALTAAFL